MGLDTWTNKIIKIIFSITMTDTISTRTTFFVGLINMNRISPM